MRKTANKIIVGTVVIVLLLIVGVLLAPMPASHTALPTRFHLLLSLSMVTLHIGAAALFITSLSTYKPASKRALRLLALGIVLSALGTLQVATLSVLGLLDSP